jgi:hypothetical protein
MFAERSRTRRFIPPCFHAWLCRRRVKSLKRPNIKVKLPPTTVSTRNRLGFLDLPGELRNAIYEEVFRHDEWDFAQHYDANGRPGRILSAGRVESPKRLESTRLALIQTCKQIHEEAWRVGFATTRFCIAATAKKTHSDIGQYIWTRAAVLPEIRIDYIKHLTINTDTFDPHEGNMNRHGKWTINRGLITLQLESLTLVTSAFRTSQTGCDTLKLRWLAQKVVHYSLEFTIPPLITVFIVEDTRTHGNVSGPVWEDG